MKSYLVPRLRGNPEIFSVRRDEGRELQTFRPRNLDVRHCKTRRPNSIDLGSCAMHLIALQACAFNQDAKRVSICKTGSNQSCSLFRRLEGQPETGSTLCIASNLACAMRSQLLFAGDLTSILRSELAYCTMFFHAETTLQMLMTSLFLDPSKAKTASQRRCNLQEPRKEMPYHA